MGRWEVVLPDGTSEIFEADYLSSMDGLLFFMAERSGGNGDLYEDVVYAVPVTRLVSVRKL